MKNNKYLSSGAAALVLLFVGLIVQDGHAAAILKSQVQVSVKADLTDTVGLASTSAPLFRQRLIGLTSGVGLNQADKVWSKSSTLAASAVDTFDLQGGLVDAFGIAFTPAKVKAILIVASAANTTNLTIQNVLNGVPILGASGTGCTAGPFGNAVIRPGTAFLLADPTLAAFAVTAGTGDLITVTNAAGASASYDIVILGASS